MRRTLTTALILAAGTVLAAGCGSKTVINTAPLSDEQKAAIKAEDERVADEESGGTANKKKGKR
jgi:hypothetical protein